MRLIGWLTSGHQASPTSKSNRALNTIPQGPNRWRYSVEVINAFTTGFDKTVKLWDVATKQELCTLTVPSEVNSVAFSPDNKVLAAASNDNKVSAMVRCPARRVFIEIIQSGADAN